jgi:Tol biopolymer transport system component/DNA-binding winged helix-turn-helix (wHTH) protein
MIQQVSHFYEFGPFRLDITERILLREGQYVPLPPKAFDTLMVLVENGGHILDKDELLKRIWPDTFVEEVNLAKKVSYLRKILGGEQSEQYIETIPKRGYRFVVPVREVFDENIDSVMIPKPAVPLAGGETTAATLEQSFKTTSEIETLNPDRLAAASASRTYHFVRRLRWAAFLLFLAILSSVTIWMIVSRPAAKSPAPHLKIVPFTSFPGSETHAAFSPDENQIAFVWGGEKGDNQDIYIKLIGTGQPLRLTSNVAADTHPTWSPDGRYIAFFRQSADSSGFYLVPALGGSERKVAEVFPYRTLTPGNSQYYSADGKFLAIADKNSQEEPFSIFLLSIETGEKQRLTAPPVGTVGDSYPAFSPDGKTLAFMRSSSSATTDLFLLPLSGGKPQQLTFDNTSVYGLAWTADGKEIVFASRRGSSLFNLWRVAVSGGTPERLPTIGQNVVSPAISPQGNYLSYTQALDETNIWRMALDSSGKGGAATSLISSTLADNGPDYSPDGQKIVFASNRSGEFGLWVCDRNGANPMPLIESGPYLTGTPRWSPNGQRIAFDSRSRAGDPDPIGNADIYVIHADGGQPTRLTDDPAEDITPSWSRDSRWVYFGSTRSGSMQIWKIPASGGEAIQVTQQGGFEGFESLDGKSFYYSKGRAVPGIWRIPVGGGEESLVLDHHSAGYWRLWALTEKGIYFATAIAPSQPVIEFFNFATGKITHIATLDKPISRSDPGISISADRRWLLFAQMDQSGSDIMIVDNFR